MISPRKQELTKRARLFARGNKAPPGDDAQNAPAAGYIISPS
jgi:hypothetical protein